VRFFAWIATGFAVYFGYGRFHSRLGLEATTADGSTILVARE
jgi:hypothetical protein